MDEVEAVHQSRYLCDKGGLSMPEDFAMPDFDVSKSSTQKRRNWAGKNLRNEIMTSKSDHTTEFFIDVRVLNASEAEGVLPKGFEVKQLEMGVLDVSRLSRC
jgi:hypothetical protein